MILARVSFFCLLILIPAGMAFGQAAPTPPPGDTPTKQNVYMGRLPKVDKSRQRDVKGYVKDERDNPIENAIVSLKDLKTGKVVSFATKKDGAYLFYDLNMDIDYELTVKAANAPEPVTKKVTRYDTRKPAVINFQLDVKKPA